MSYSGTLPLDMPMDPALPFSANDENGSSKVLPLPTVGSPIYTPTYRRHQYEHSGMNSQRRPLRMTHSTSSYPMQQHYRFGHNPPNSFAYPLTGPMNHGVPYESQSIHHFSRANNDPSQPRSIFNGRMGQYRNEYLPASIHQDQPILGEPVNDFFSNSIFRPYSRNSGLSPWCRPVATSDDSPRYGTEAPGSSSFDNGDSIVFVDEQRKKEAVFSDPSEKEVPYAQLIYRALITAPKYQMILRDIYQWFIDHTDKASDKEAKGWQNSIRHNLSMNGAFEKVEIPEGDNKQQKGCLWRLTKEAIEQGVKSTTRYRTKQPQKRGKGSAAPQRQASGSKGGLASKRANQRNNRRRSQRLTGTDVFFAGTSRSPASVPRRMSEVPQYNESTLNPHISYPNSPYFITGGPPEADIPPPILQPSTTHESNPFVDTFTPAMPSYKSNTPATPSVDMSESSYAGTPESTVPISYDGYHLIQHPHSQQLFYGSSESGDDPPTPASQEEMDFVHNSNDTGTGTEYDIGTDEFM